LAYHVKIFPEMRLAYFRFCDEISAATGKEAFLQYTKDESFDPSYLMVTDARDVTKIHATFQKILFGTESLRSLLARFKPGTISAILLRDSTHMGYARMLEQVLALLSPIEVRIAFDEDELRTIAGRPDLNIGQLAVA
jgi:hypothetical protein